MSVFHHTVSALVYSLIAAHCPEDPRQHWFLENVCVRFVLARYQGMPDYLKLPLLLATLSFTAATWLTTLQPFHRLPPERRLYRIARWRTARFGPWRDLVRFYESLTVFSWYAAYDEATRAAR